MIDLTDPNVVQRISLPLEMAGLFFAFVEIFRPKHAEWWEALFDGMSTNFIGVLSTEMYRDDIKKAGLRKWVIGLGIPILVSGLVDYLIWLWLKANGIPSGQFILWFFGVSLAVGIAIMYIRVHWVLKGLIAVVFIAPLYPLGAVAIGMFWLLSRVFRFFDRTGKGRAVGGFGLCLGCLGLAGEVYQVAMLNDDVLTRLEYVAMIGLLAIPVVLLALFFKKLVKKNKTPRDFQKVGGMAQLRAKFRRDMEKVRQQ